jgi:hypothetical protein
MLKIIKCGTEYNIPRSNVVKVDTTYDGILVTLRDSTEIRFTMQVSPQIKAIMPIVQTSTADMITLNLDAAMSGYYDRVITLTMKPKQEPQMIRGGIKIVKENKTQTTTETPKKKGGRPKGSKTTKK